MKINRSRAAAWLIPLSCFTISAVLIGGRHVAFVRAETRGKRVDAELFQARLNADALARQSQDVQYACAPRVAKEEASFFADLRRNASGAGISIARWRSESSTFGEKAGGGQSGPPPANQAERDRALKGVTEARCTLTLDGAYPALRDFVRVLWKADRLYALTDVHWSRTDTGNELTLTLCRYIAPAPAKPTTTETPSVTGPTS